MFDTIKLDWGLNLRVGNQNGGTGTSLSGAEISLQRCI